MKGSSKKISYERRAYESVDEKSVEMVKLYHEKRRKKNPGTNGLMMIKIHVCYVVCFLIIRVLFGVFFNPLLPEFFFS